MSTQIFTPQEANRRLPLVRQIVEDILKNGQKLKALSLFEPTNAVQNEQQLLIKKIETLQNELETLGCQFKDYNFDIGLVDFPAIINGQEVLLCWRNDERNIRWYHKIDAGYRGRLLIPEELL